LNAQKVLGRKNKEAQMRKKFLLLGIALLLLPATTNAQIRGGFKIGGNLNFASFEPDVPVGDLSSAVSFNFGGGLDFDVSKNFGIEVNLLYNNHKAEWDYRGFDPYYGLWFDYDITFSMHSLSLPVLAKVKFPSRQVTPFLGIGPEFSLTLSHKAKVKISANGLSDETTVDMGDTTEAVNFAVTLCGGVDINLHKVILSPELRFSLGLVDLDSSEIGTARNSQIVFFFGVKF